MCVFLFLLASDCLNVDAFSTINAGTPFVFRNTRKGGGHETAAPVRPELRLVLS